MKLRKEQEKAYQVLLYYCFTPIENPEEFRHAHHQLCIDLELRGRIIISDEGLNGTVSGLKENCQRYMKKVKADARFDSLEFKIEDVPAHTFKKLNVRLKPEIVHSSLNHIKPYEKTAQHLTGKEFKKLKEEEDVVLVDVRSNYEHKLGKFKNAITFDIDHFREFPDKVKELEKYKDKKVITYCTGGIKCEKASAYLMEQGFGEVYQLLGGIIKYGIEEGGEDFEGKCYVFDNRVAVDVNRVNPTVLSTCYVCGTQTDNMVNCANPTCNIHTTICESCLEELEGACSPTCKAHPEKRPYNGKGYYTKKQNGYNPRIGLKR